MKAVRGSTLIWNVKVKVPKTNLDLCLYSPICLWMEVADVFQTRVWLKRPSEVMVVSVLLNSWVCFSDCLSVCLHVHLSVLSFCLFGKCLCLYSGCHGRASRCWIFTSSTGSSFRCSNVLPTRPSTHLKHTNISFFMQSVWLYIWHTKILASLYNQCDFSFETHKY